MFTSDFGEAAPGGGIYRGDPAGFVEHNLYPLRYARTVAEATEAVTGESVQHARAAWAGSQRYPLHFSGDPETSDGGLLGTLRGGLSLGLCGFTFWTHFVGGFPRAPDAGLYLRWLAFGVLCSHVRCHGAPPREPWEFGDDFLGALPAPRRVALLAAAVRGGAGGDRLRARPPAAAPALLRVSRRPRLVAGGGPVPARHGPAGGAVVRGGRASAALYLPPGRWHRFAEDEGTAVDGPGWHTLAVEEVPAAVLVRDGASPRLAEPAQHTGQLDWDGAREWRPAT